CARRKLLRARDYW
nr:immunoglobulin heavy chain junction region [Mus musculus]